MKAKKMFEQLKLKDAEYYEDEDYEYIHYSWIETLCDKTERDMGITFWLNEKTITLDEYKVYKQDNSEYSMEFVVDLEILKIINKQVKELGWNKRK